MDDDMAIMAKATGKPATSLVVWWYVAMSKPGAARKRLTLLSRFGCKSVKEKKKEGPLLVSLAAAAGALSRSVFYTAFRR